jgi:hypothetical protein
VIEEVMEYQVLGQQGFCDLHGSNRSVATDNLLAEKAGLHHLIVGSTV